MAEHEGFYQWSWRQSRLLGDEPCYCEAPTLPGDERKSTDVDRDHEEQLKRRLRCEVQAIRVTEGKSINLISTKLRGPFDASSGWRNPWSRTAVPEHELVPESRDNRVIPETQLLPEPQELSRTSTPSEDDGRPSTAPEIESLKPPISIPSTVDTTRPEPSPVQSELARVESWVRNIPTVRLDRDEFWAPAAAVPRKTAKKSKTKKGVQSDLWLLKRNDHRKITIDNSDAPDTPSAGRTRLVPPSKSEAPGTTLKPVKAGEAPAAKEAAAPRRSLRTRAGPRSSRRIAKIPPAPLEKAELPPQEVLSEQSYAQLEEAIAQPEPEQRDMEALQFETQADESFVFHRRAREPTVPREAPAPHHAPNPSSISSLTPAPSDLDLTSESGRESAKDDGKSSVADDEESQTPSSSHGSTDPFGRTPQKPASTKKRVLELQGPPLSAEPEVSSPKQQQDSPMIDQTKDAGTWNDTTMIVTQACMSATGGETDDPMPDRYSQLKGQHSDKHTAVGENNVILTNTARKDPVSSSSQQTHPSFFDTVLLQAPSATTAPVTVPSQTIKTDANGSNLIGEDATPRPLRNNYGSVDQSMGQSSTSSAPDDTSILNRYHQVFNNSVVSQPLASRGHHEQACTEDAYPTQSQYADLDEEEIVIPASQSRWVVNASQASSPAKSFGSSPVKVASQSLLKESQESALHVPRFTQSPWVKTDLPIIPLPSQGSVQYAITATKLLSGVAIAKKRVEDDDVEPTSQSHGPQDSPQHDAHQIAPLSPSRSPAKPSPPRVSTQEQSRWTNTRSPLKRHRAQADVEPAALPSPLGELCDNAAPHPDTGLPITLRPFSSFLTSPQKRRRLEDPHRSLSGGLPSTQDLLGATIANPWENSPIPAGTSPSMAVIKSSPSKPKKTVHWAPLPSGDDFASSTPRAAKTYGRAASPPPSENFTYQPGEKSVYARHFAIMAGKTAEKKGRGTGAHMPKMAGRKSALKNPLLPSESQQVLSSPAVVDMAERFLDADASAAPTSSTGEVSLSGLMDIDTGVKGGLGGVLKTFGGQETKLVSQNDDVNDVLHNLDDFVGACFRLDEEVKGVL